MFMEIRQTEFGASKNDDNVLAKKDDKGPQIEGMLSKDPSLPDFNMDGDDAISEILELSEREGAENEKDKEEGKKSGKKEKP